METSEHFISMCDQDPLLHENIVTGDETGATSSIRNQNGNRWRSSNSPRTKKSCLQKSNVKTLLVTFFENKGIIHKEFVPAGQTINAAFYQAVLNPDCYSVSGLSCTGLENGCWSTIIPLHTVRSVCANSWLRRR